MKKWIIASMVCCFPLFLFGMVNTFVPFLPGKNNLNILFIYVCVVGFCLGTILTTMFKLIHYSNKIDKIDKYEDFLYKEEDKLRNLIKHYNMLISEQNDKRSVATEE